MLKQVLIAATLYLAVSLAAPSAIAQHISYSYAELGYANPDLNELDDGWLFRGSTQIGSQVYLFGDFFRLDGPMSEQDLSSIGIGRFNAISAKTDYLVELAYEDFHPGDSGLSLAVGLRSNLAPRLELGVKFGYADAGESWQGYLATLHALFKLNENWSFNLSAESFDGDQIYSTGLRFSL